MIFPPQNSSNSTIFFFDQSFFFRSADGLMILLRRKEVIRKVSLIRRNGRKWIWKDSKPFWPDTSDTFRQQAITKGLLGSGRLLATPGTKENFNEDEFWMIKKFVHFCDEKKPDKNDWFYRIRPLVNEVIRQTNVMYTLSQNLTLDESMIKFSGRPKYKAHIQVKHDRLAVIIRFFAFSHHFFDNINCYLRLLIPCILNKLLSMNLFLFFWVSWD